MADLRLPSQQAFVDAVDGLIDELFEPSLQTLDAWPSTGLLSFFKEQPLRSLGEMGTRLLLKRMGVQECPPQFCEKAYACIEAAHARIDQPLSEDGLGDLLVDKTWSYADYELQVLMTVAGNYGEPTPHCCRGVIVKDNGFKHAQRSPFLRPAEMYIYEWVDRAQCGEYQLLAEICAVIGQHVDLRSRGSCMAVRGLLQVYVLSPPCLSCMSCFRQFQQLLPGVEMQISIGRTPFTIRL